MFLDYSRLKPYLVAREAKKTTTKQQHQLDNDTGSFTRRSRRSLLKSVNMLKNEVFQEFLLTISQFACSKGKGKTQFYNTSIKCAWWRVRHQLSLYWSTKICCKFFINTTRALGSSFNIKLSLFNLWLYSFIIEQTSPSYLVNKRHRSRDNSVE